MSKPTGGLAGQIATEGAQERDIVARLSISCPHCKTLIQLKRLSKYNIKINGGGTCTKTAD